MSDVDLERRVEILEENMDQLRDVPVRLAAVESQIVQLGNEMRAGFSAVRTEISTLESALRTEMRAQGEELRMEMRALNDETCTQMRILHEEVISRFALLQEGAGKSSRGSRRVRKTR